MTARSWMRRDGRLSRLTQVALHPPDALRLGPFRPGAFRSRLHSEQTAAWLGIGLGISFALCFVTGLLSHGIQHPPSWFVWPPRPAGLYRVTQSLHVATGIAAIPLLLAKLWVVYPRLWTWPPVEGLAHAVERVSLLPLVAGGVFMLLSGLANVGHWYPWRFFFPAAHFWAAWITIGALVVHVGAKSAVTAEALRRRAGSHALQAAGAPEGLTRRGFLGAVGAATGLLTLTTLGQTVRPLAPLGLLAPRHPDVGPQGLPVNTTARQARVLDAVADPAYAVRVEGKVTTPLVLPVAELRRLPQHEATLPISCVEGWSASGVWRGVRVRDLLDMAGAAHDATVEVRSVQPPGRYSQSTLNPLHARDPDTLLALDLGGEPLHVDHGAPVRLVGPNRPGVLQTKWVGRIVVL
jgi:DMSO/TMAO reductase YedYZ molybdopterin-dependent catalytic subunit